MTTEAAQIIQKARDAGARQYNDTLMVYIDGAVCFKLEQLLAFYRSARCDGLGAAAARLHSEVETMVAGTYKDALKHGVWMIQHEIKTLKELSK